MRVTREVDDGDCAGIFQMSDGSYVVWDEKSGAHISPEGVVLKATWKEGLEIDGHEPEADAETLTSTIPDGLQEAYLGLMMNVGHMNRTAASKEEMALLHEIFESCDEWKLTYAPRA